MADEEVEAMESKKGKEKKKKVKEKDGVVVSLSPSERKFEVKKEERAPALLAADVVKVVGLLDCSRSVLRRRLGTGDWGLGAAIPADAMFDAAAVGVA
ncbi:Os08g0326450 [Oryza sativa Japonica Group]|jgi:hypothetical protein|uniref:Os08g0326450 protein n=1 Tax=Oryza sativa subsp. japonica TaxID=39947 RepID=A0A0P0XEN7_ORYSJ|nr:Os08g0326450 [Oryza sativa Japonica Group]